MAKTKIERKVIWVGLYWEDESDKDGKPGARVRIVAAVARTRGWFSRTPKATFAADIEDDSRDAMGDSRWKEWDERSHDFFLREFGKALLAACPELPPEPHVLWSGDVKIHTVAGYQSKTFRIVNTEEGFVLEYQIREDGLGNVVWESYNVTPSEIFEAFGEWGLAQTESSQNK